MVITSLFLFVSLNNIIKESVKATLLLKQKKQIPYKIMVLFSNFNVQKIKATIFFSP